MAHNSAEFHKEDLASISPEKRAKTFETEGFSWLHVVDLDAAFSESPVNEGCIEGIIKSAKIPVQISGGIHTIHVIEKWVERGASSVVITSAALKNPELVKEAAKKFPGKIAVKIDSIGGYVARTGWANTAPLKALDLALRVEDVGVAKIIYANMNLDGALNNVDMEATIDFAFALSVPVIAAGGVHGLQDLAELKAHSRSGVVGLILGRTLLNGRLKAKDALKIASA